jgi:hypothetical protein
MRKWLIALTALPLLCPPAASEETVAPGNIVFEATTKNVDRNGAAQDVRIATQVWSFPGRGRSPAPGEALQELPLRGFYIAHLLSGTIAATTDDQAVEYKKSGAYWSVKPGATMRIRTIGELAVIETIVVRK